MWTQLYFDKNMWTQSYFLYFYHQKLSSVFPLPHFVFCPKFELSLKFAQRRLLHNQSFLPTVLVDHHPYPAAANCHYYT